MVPSQDSYPRPVNRKSDALAIVQPRNPSKYNTVFLNIKHEINENYILQHGFVQIVSKIKINTSNDYDNHEQV